MACAVLGRWCLAGDWDLLGAEGTLCLSTLHVIYQHMNSTPAHRTEEGPAMLTVP